jgi:hypothetical protein
MSDRNYWRACDTSRLIEEARDSGHELAIVLAERLKDRDEEDEKELADGSRRLKTARSTATSSTTRSTSCAPRSKNWN